MDDQSIEPSTDRTAGTVSLTGDASAQTTWLAPLVAQVTEQGETIGRLSAQLEQQQTELNHLHDMLAVVMAERDDVHRQVRAAQARRGESPVATDSAPPKRPRSSDLGVKPRQQRWWLRLFGVDEA